MDLLMKWILFFIFFSMILSCESDINKDDHFFNNQLNFLHKPKYIKTYSSIKKINKKGKVSVFEKLDYTIGFVKGVDFFKKNNLEIDDVSNLKNVSVIIFEMKTDSLKNIFDLNRNSISKSEYVEYINVNMINDFTLLQSNQQIKLSGLHYENSFGSNNKIRVYLFTNKVQLDKPIRVLFNDRYMGSGLVNYTLKKLDYDK